jgi:outer membrane immunogenic protein
MLKVRARAVAVVAGVAGLVAVTGTASADRYERRGVAAAPCCFSWTGFYYGINAGYGFSADDDGVSWRETLNTGVGIQNFFGPVNVGSLDVSGAFGGGQVGYNYQVGSVVFGVEADFQGADISDDVARTVDYFGGPDRARFVAENKVGWFGTLRPRLGYAWGNSMAYVTGGVAWGGIKHSMAWAQLTNGNVTFKANDQTSKSDIGYVLGAGFEHAFSCCWSLKLEYQYLNFGSEHYVAPELFGPTGPGGVATAFAIQSDSHTDFHTVRVGLNWKWHDRRDKPLK